MFIQIIQGQVADQDHLRRQIDKWRDEIKPKAKGYLGSTGGVTSDGTSIYLVRFESEEAARANSDLPEQGEWWSETKRAFSGEVTFHDCREVDTVLAGGSNDAGFVQIIQGKTNDKEQMRRLGEEFTEKLPEIRPDVIGGIIAWHGDDGGFTQAVYFTSEEEARQREKETEDHEMRDRFISLFDGAPAFFDLRDPEFD